MISFNSKTEFGVQPSETLFQQLKSVFIHWQLLIVTEVEVDAAASVTEVAEGPIIPSPFKSWSKAPSSDSKAKLVPDTPLITIER